MTITREQLELAAKAAGINVLDHDVLLGFRFINDADDENCPFTDYWNPDRDHGQLLDLAMACNIDICSTEGFIGYYRTKFDYVSINVDCQDFPSLAEAVITAAAEQQLAKEEKE